MGNNTSYENCKYCNTSIQYTTDDKEYYFNSHYYRCKNYPFISYESVLPLLADTDLFSHLQNLKVIPKDGHIRKFYSLSMFGGILPNFDINHMEYSKNKQKYLKLEQTPIIFFEFFRKRLFLKKIEKNSFSVQKKDSFDEWNSFYTHVYKFFVENKEYDFVRATVCGIELCFADRRDKCDEFLRRFKNNFVDTLYSKDVGVERVKNISDTVSL